MRFGFDPWPQELPYASGAAEKGGKNLFVLFTFKVCFE